MFTLNNLNSSLYPWDYSRWYLSAFYTGQILFWFWRWISYIHREYSCQKWEDCHLTPCNNMV